MSVARIEQTMNCTARGSQDSECPDRDSNRALLERKAEEVRSHALSSCK
jgi:hypothetical protein